MFFSVYVSINLRNEYTYIRSLLYFLIERKVTLEYCEGEFFIKLFEGSIGQNSRRGFIFRLLFLYI